MIKILTTVTTEETKEYPCIKKATQGNGDFLVIFIAPKTGVQIYPQTGDFLKLIDSWAEGNFEKFKGKLTLENV